MLSELVSFEATMHKTTMRASWQKAWCSAHGWKPQLIEDGTPNVYNQRLECLHVCDAVSVINQGR